MGKRNANRLRVLRAERRMTQRTLSLKARVNVARISYIENGYYEPNDRERSRLARALGAEVLEVFPIREQAAS